MTDIIDSSDTLPGPEPEELFGDEIEQLHGQLEAIITVADRRLKAGHSAEVIRFWDADRHSFVAHSAMTRVLELHGVLDDYYQATPGVTGGRILTCAEYDDGTVMTILKSGKTGGSLVVSDTVGEDSKGNPRNGQVLLYRK